MIKISNGFLSLTRHDNKTVMAVKGSSIIAVSIDFYEENKNGSLVFIGCSGWAVSMVETIEEIIQAVAESYKQAFKR